MKFTITDGLGTEMIKMLSGLDAEYPLIRGKYTVQVKIGESNK